MAMKSFAGKFAVVSGGAQGMGRSLVLQLAKAGCSSSFSDLNEKNIAETIRLAEKVAPAGVKVTGHVADVAKEEDWIKFRKEALAEHSRSSVNLLFNNAGIGVAGSFINGNRADWERCYDICWKGVYLGTRTFIKDLIAADQARIVNTSSANGFHAVLALGPGVPHTAYSAAKFAVKGFSEALIVDLRHNAPHVGVSVVMPGHIGTSIGRNSLDILGSTEALPAEIIEKFEKNAPLGPDGAAEIILKGVKDGRWRILVGKDAEYIDAAIRKEPEMAYNQDFLDGISKAGYFIQI